MAKVEVEYSAPVYVLTMSEDERDQLVRLLKAFSHHFPSYPLVEGIYQELVWRDA